MPRETASAPTSADDFQRAAAAAKAASRPVWLELSASEQTRAIYDQLRQIDAARAKAMAFVSGRRGRFRVAGESVRRKATA